MKFTVVIHSAEEGGYWAEIPALPGCVSQGETLEEVQAGIYEAAEGWLESEKGEALEKIQAGIRQSAAWLQKQPARF